MERSRQAVSSTSSTGPAAMLVAVMDLPNLITLTGAAFAMAALALVLAGAHDAALCCVLWSHLADSLDGFAARCIKGRAAWTGHFGKTADTLADFLSAGVFPFVLVVALSDLSLLSVASGMLICGAGIVRLSYFDAFGLDEGRFVGLPLPHNILVLPLVYLVARNGFPGALSIVLPVVMIVLTVLHLSPLRFPKFSPKAIAASAVYIGVMNLLLLR